MQVEACHVDISEQGHFFRLCIPATTLAYLAVVVAKSVLLTHPLYLLGALSLRFRSPWPPREGWKTGGKVSASLTFMAVLMVINADQPDRRLYRFIRGPCSASGQGSLLPWRP